MRYNSKKSVGYSTIYGSTYICGHSVYNRRALFTINDKGLAVIQQRYTPKKKKQKTTYWSEIDPCLINELYLHEKFEVFFNDCSAECSYYCGGARILSGPLLSVRH